jgi:hypothetical protein
MEEIMQNKGIKIVSTIVILSFLNSCIERTTTHYAPMEKVNIRSAKDVTIELKDGTILKLTQVSIEYGKIIGYTKDIYSGKSVKKEIDFSLIKSVKSKKSDYIYLVLYGGVAVVTGLLIIGMETAPPPPPSGCCPFLYSFDGDNYVFDAEPYGGAICRSLKRSEWCEMEHLKAVNNQYKIVIANELDETQYTDELKLLIVDHPQGTKVAPDALGEIHSILNPVAPIRVVNDVGNDVSSMFIKKDGKYWQTPNEEKDLNKIKNLKDELVFEFPKPMHAKKAKVLVNACTSFWGSQISKKFLKLYGNKLSDWYTEVNNFGPAFHRLMDWYYDEELYLLQIRVNTTDAWKSKGVIFGGGPFISENKIYTIDISDVTTSTLKIKLTPAVNFWMIDHLCVDYTDNVDFIRTEIEAFEVLDNNRLDVCGVLSKLDNEYFIMPDKGSRAELIFKAPSKIEGMSRTIFSKTTGYYHIHLQPEGEPQYEILEKINSQPGFSIQYALKEYVDSYKRK